ncbi:hypothetical protein O9G_006077 [Rozella allomycis CSF55]|uniref:Uncharacterized protein n=1 Tax=Rozella allomycis (strain CSF55) TaxID=988480 RepID=A0A075B3K2_ROZAC|nr:hypothetical protein O9G_006077 [Rozella allomycis CSF55]|eukprot:EPZ35438.1 hypothetical protein O9G_006077 [Rozella allomycis CSF55]
MTRTLIINKLLPSQAISPILKPIQRFVMDELNYLKSLRRKKFVEWTEEEKASFIDYKNLNELIEKLSLEIEKRN